MLCIVDGLMMWQALLTPCACAPPSLQELLLRAFMHVCNGPLHSLTVPSPAASDLDHLESALYRRRAITAAARFEFSGRLQFWTVPESGMYRITACGAKAADGAYRCPF